MRRLALFIGLLLPYILYTFYSYTQTDPNLVLSSNPVYWSFQQRAWHIGYEIRPVATYLYLAILTGTFLSFVVSVTKVNKRDRKWLLLGIIGVLLVSYPALSHDVFNYLFNAKMAVVYNADPHVRTALEFADDPWVRFMHNTHTPAPYGYGWTALSILPYIFGLGKFTLTLMSFRLFMVVGLGALVLGLRSFASAVQWSGWERRRWLLLLNPLLLIETVSTAHNDVWMMALAVWGIVVLVRTTRSMSILHVARRVSLAAILFALSVSIKLATMLLLPSVTLLFFTKFSLGKDLRRKLQRVVQELPSILLFLPLFTARSQQFHPWYLIWCLTFLPFVRARALRLLFLAFSASSMARYLPYLWNGSYSTSILVQQRAITWIGGLGVWMLLLAVSKACSERGE